MLTTISFHPLLSYFSSGRTSKKYLILASSHPYWKQHRDPSAFNSCSARRGTAIPTLQWQQCHVSDWYEMLFKVNFTFLRHTVWQVVRHSYATHLFKCHLLQKFPSKACSAQSWDFQIAVWVYHWLVMYFSSDIHPWGPCKLCLQGDKLNLTQLQQHNEAKVSMNLIMGQLVSSSRRISLCHLYHDMKCSCCWRGKAASCNAGCRWYQRDAKENFRYSLSKWIQTIMVSIGKHQVFL